MPPLLASAGIQPVDYLIVFGYLLAMLLIGWRLSRKQESVEDFFVGGRKMPWLATGLSMIATLMSTLSYLGTPGEIIQHGIGQSLSLLVLPFAFLVVGFLWLPFFMRLRLTSAYEYIERRFGTPTRMLAVLLYLYMRFVWMGAIIFTASRAVALITGDTAPQAIESLTGGMLRFSPQGWFYTVLLSTGLFSTLYTMLGGIKAVIWTDVMQFAVLFCGAAATLIAVTWYTGTGPVDWWRNVTSVAHDLPPAASWDLSARVTICWTLLGAFMWHVCTHASDQVALQRYFTTASARDARRTAAVNYAADTTMQLLLALVGAALLTYYLQFPGELPAGVSDPRNATFADQIFPRFIEYGLPAGLTGLVLAALFAVAQSSIDSGINSTATVITVDLVRRFRRQPLSPRAELTMARWLTVGIGVLVTAMGVGVALLMQQTNVQTGESQGWNILDLQMRSFNCVLGPLGAVFMAGILLRHVGQSAALAAGIIGSVCGFVFAYMDLMFRQADGTPMFGSPSTYLIVPLSWSITFFLAALLGGFLPGPRPEQVRGLTWRSVVRGDNRDLPPAEGAAS